MFKCMGSHGLGENSLPQLDQHIALALVLLKFCFHYFSTRQATHVGMHALWLITTQLMYNIWNQLQMRAMASTHGACPTRGLVFCHGTIGQPLPMYTVLF